MRPTPRLGQTAICKCQVDWIGNRADRQMITSLLDHNEAGLVSRESRPKADEDSSLCRSPDAIKCHRICIPTWRYQRPVGLEHNGRWTPCLSRISHRGGLANSPLDV